MNEKASLHEFFGYTIESITNFTTTEMRLWLVYSKINVTSFYYTLITFYYLNNYEIYNFGKKEKKEKEKHTIDMKCCLHLQEKLDFF